MTANDPPTPPPDDGLEWLRAVRRELAAEANHDPVEMLRLPCVRERQALEKVFRTRRVLVPAVSPDEQPVDPSLVPQSAREHREAALSCRAAQ